MAEYLCLGGPLHGERVNKLRPIRFRVTGTPIKLGPDGVAAVAPSATSYTDYRPYIVFLRQDGVGETFFVPVGLSPVAVNHLIAEEIERRAAAA